MKITYKNFKIQDDDEMEICFNLNRQEHEIVFPDLNGISAAKARRLAKWLIGAAAVVDDANNPKNVSSVEKQDE